MGSINDKGLVDEKISYFKPDIIFHSAAYKHVSLVEQNVIEGIKNNLFGTINILQSSISNKVSNLYLYLLTKQLTQKYNRSNQAFSRNVYSSFKWS